MNAVSGGTRRTTATCPAAFPSSVGRAARGSTSPLCSVSLAPRELQGVSCPSLFEVQIPRPLEDLAPISSTSELAAPARVPGGLALACCCVLGPQGPAWQARFPQAGHPLPGRLAGICRPAGLCVGVSLGMERR